MNCSADVFIEEGGSVNVQQGAGMTFRNGSQLVLQDGAKLILGQDASIKMSGDMELDLNRLVFVDSATGYRYKISFQEHPVSGGNVTVMNYERVQQQEKEAENERLAVETERATKELDERLKRLGI